MCSAPLQQNLIVSSQAPYVSGAGWSFAYPTGRSSLSVGDSTTIVTVSSRVVDLPLVELALEIDVGASWSVAVAWIGGQTGIDLGSTTPVVTFAQMGRSPILTITEVPSVLGAIDFLPATTVTIAPGVTTTVYPIGISLTAGGTSALASIAFCQWLLTAAVPKGPTLNLLRGTVEASNV